jgi:hypothetical protein
MNVALVSSWGTPCGIAEHSKLLVQYAMCADLDLQIVPNASWLDPAAFLAARPVPDLLHLNYHRGLHSQWTPEIIQQLHIPVVITFHDTFEVQPDRLPWDLLACENVKAMVVHEPCDLLTPPDIERARKVYYWRQGVPEPQRPAEVGLEWICPGIHAKPVLGTLGFDFPWKNYDLLADATEEAGWNLLILGPASESLNRFNSRHHVRRLAYPETRMAVEHLSACDATAFLYTCANSGTSGAIRLGLAAGRPLLWCECRQFRDLDVDLPEITRVEPTQADLVQRLTFLRYPRWQMQIVALRHRDSWTKLGAQYATLYHEVLNG